jgi:hypothetical protein
MKGKFLFFSSIGVGCPINNALKKVEKEKVVALTDFL